ncbi:DUF3068 domain-containing protein [Salinispora tropica]|uniref:DUF3068 domain-containing protein n=1 Tax=Salinispora tropica (strain ATCC BAA-916 / DSM 44818 / JCM 13857 / NBRC 105044 / CNB-440) TaxID=369723 RepID=A4X1D0_SALTO|nr:DUF3068 domain-containing protein [Salinispora tropica]ABP52680.1 hypothetical protein Strop_0195 [Salinispora tropica CNB-440]
MKLRVSAALFGLGVLLLVFAVGLPLYVAPAISKLPYDLKPTTLVAEANNARFLQITADSETVTVEVPRATLRSTIEVLPQPGDTKDRLPDQLKGDAVIWDVYQTVVRSDTQDPITMYSTQLALYRVSAEAAPWDDQWLKQDDSDETPRGNVSYSGLIYKFPFGAEKKDYPVFDRDLKEAIPATFVGTETVEGVEVYRYEQRIENRVLDTPEESLQVLLSTFAPGSTTGEIVYSNTRTYWVDPVTGAWVDVREQQRKELRPDVGSTTVLLDADFNYTDDTVNNSVESVKTNRLKIGLARLWGPIAAGVLGLIALAVGLRLFLQTGGAAGRHAAAAPAAGGPATGKEDQDSS